MRAQTARRSRRRLDARLAGVARAEAAAPVAGWVRAVREALGMSQADLAVRLDVTQQTVQQIEQNERDGRVRLDTLRKAAEAMDCELVYALVPRTSLEEVVTRQALRVVGEEKTAAERTMALEAQEATLAPDALRDLADRLVDTRQLWRVYRVRL